MQNGSKRRTEGSERARRREGGRRLVGSANTVFLTSCSLDREEMKSLQAALQKQLDEANERAEKQQATVRRRRPDHQHPVSPLTSAVTCHTGPSVIRAHYSSAASLAPVPRRFNWNSQKEQSGGFVPFPQSQGEKKKKLKRPDSGIITWEHVLIYPSIIPSTVTTFPLIQRWRPIRRHYACNYIPLERLRH